MKAFSFGLLLFVFWLLLSGHTEPLLLGLGLASVVLTLILAERIEDENTGPQVAFFRPGDEESLTEWAQDFTPGRLYTMGRLSRRNR